METKPGRRFFIRVSAAVLVLSAPLVASATTTPAAADASEPLSEAVLSEAAESFDELGLADHIYLDDSGEAVVRVPANVSQSAPELLDALDVLDDVKLVRSQYSEVDLEEFRETAVEAAEAVDLAEGEAILSFYDPETDTLQVVAPPGTEDTGADVYGEDVGIQESAVVETFSRR